MIIKVTDYKLMVIKIEDENGPHKYWPLKIPLNHL